MEFNVQPYYDDFESNAKENNYMRLLFRPGYAVQARELTQIQSILQNQIKSFADHIFQDGSPVIGGNISLDNRVSSIKLEETYNNEDIEVDDFLDKVLIRVPDSLVQAKCIAVFYPSGGSPTLMIKYLTGVEFDDGDVLKIAGTNQQAKLISSGAKGKGTVASINDGIFYVDGFFIQVQQQNVVVDAYNQTANAKIGLEISDDVVDHLIDTSLLDPAQGAFNYQAPGADRYQFNLNLATRPVATAVDESSFFELMRLENGVVTKQVKYPIYSELEKTLARRTYDESGDYTVVPFKATLQNSIDPSKYVIEIEPGKAYVKGFEFETIGKFRFETDKPRRSGIDERAVYESTIGTPYGNYLQTTRVFGKTTGATGFIDININDEVDLLCVSSESANAGVRGGNLADFTYYSNNKIGTARIRNVKRYQPQPVEILAGANTSALPPSDTNGVYNIYVTDVNIKPKIFKIRAGTNSDSIVLPTTASPVDNAYTNMTITMMPYRLETVANANVNWPNVLWVHRHGANTTNLGTKLQAGDLVRILDQTRTVTAIKSGGKAITVDKPIGEARTSGGAFGDFYIEKQVPFSANVTGVTRTISRYDGATRTAFFSTPFDSSYIAAADSIVQLNPKLKDVESFVKSDFDSLSLNEVFTSANVYAPSKDSIGDVYLKENDFKSLIFDLPKQYVQRSSPGNPSLQNVDYYHNKYIPSITVTSSQFQIAPSVNLESVEKIDWLATNSSIEDNLIVVVKDKGSATTVANGDILRLTSAQVTSITNGIAVDLSVNGLATGVASVSVYVLVRLDNVETNIRKKTFVSNTSYTLEPYTYPSNAAFNDVSRFPPGTIATASEPLGEVDPFDGVYQARARVAVDEGLIWIPQVQSLSLSPGESINLYTPDILRINKIIAGTWDFYPNTEYYLDVTERFDFDSGQKDEMYDHAKIILKQGYETPNANMLIHVDYYKHSEDTSNTFFSVDSYSADEYEKGRIPKYYSRKYGLFNLRDCIDFRPTRKLANTQGVLIGGKLSDPDYTISVSFKYWLPRIDKLLLSKTKEFKILNGVSDSRPLPPDDDSDSMTLYTIYLPPYVHDVSEVTLEYNENRRYTMKDLAAMDKRIERVEYYTSLNNVENRTFEDPAFYSDNTKKEKYGLVGESFENFDIADYKNEDFSLSITDKGVTATAEVFEFGLEPYSYENTVENNKTISLSYVEVPAVSQPLSSNVSVAVQPFLFGSFIGNINLSPEVDYWLSEELKPEIIRAPEQITTIREVIRNQIVEKTVVQTIQDRSLVREVNNLNNRIATLTNDLLTLQQESANNNTVTAAVCDLPPTTELGGQSTNSAIYVNTTGQDPPTFTIIPNTATTTTAIRNNTITDAASNILRRQINNSLAARYGNMEPALNGMYWANRNGGAGGPPNRTGGGGGHINPRGGNDPFSGTSTQTSTTNETQVTGSPTYNNTTTLSGDRVYTGGTSGGSRRTVTGGRGSTLSR